MAKIQKTPAEKFGDWVLRIAITAIVLGVIWYAAVYAPNHHQQPGQTTEQS